MAYIFRYRLQSAPTSTLDGSGTVAHDIWALASLDGGDYIVVPGRHKTIMVPGDELQAVMDMDNDAAKVAAYKNVLASNLNTMNTPVTGWSLSALEQLMLANDAAANVAAEADDYIVNTLGQTYPVEFNL